MKEEMEFFTVKPNLHQIYGKTVTKDLQFDEYTEDKLVHQTMKDLVLITEIKRESTFDGIKTVEESKLIQTIPEGKILIWNEQIGYIVPSIPVCTLEELKNDIEDMKNVYDDIYRSDKNDIKGNEEKSIITN